MSIRRLTTLTAAGAAALTAATAAPALAHDTLVRSDPAEGQTLQQAPEEITLTYSADLQDLGGQIIVRDDQGQVVTDQEPAVDGTDLVQQLPDQARQPGDYTVAWRAVSSDGHPIEGQLHYTVAGQGTGAASGQASEQASGAPEAQGQATGQEQDSGPSLGLILGGVGGLLVLAAAGAALYVSMQRKARRR